MSQTPQLPPLSFGLGAVFELIGGIALLLALVTQLTLLGLFLAFLGSLVLLSAHHVIFATNRKKAVAQVVQGVVALMILSLIVGLLLPAVSAANEAGRRAQCGNNLRQIALALRFYHDDHGHFPPPYIADADGKPMHSWRVLILPYMELKYLYDQYDFNEPWDGPNNRKLASQWTPTFRCPSDPSLPREMTSYFYVVGPGRTKPGQQHQRLDDFADGQTILLVESSSARIHWMEPRDLTVEDILAGKNTAEAPCACSNHGRSERGAWRSPGCFLAAMQDGSVRPISAELDTETLRALLTIDGGEEIDHLRSSGDEYLWPGVWVLLGAEVAFIALAIARRLRIARHKPREVPPG
jgi:hypothetical protein